MYLSKRFIIISLYFIIVNLFGIILHYIEYIELFFSNEYNDKGTVFDYIIVGCGSAGAIVARRLAEDKNVKVLILEAGRHGNTLFDIPSVGLLLQKTLYDWQYVTTPQSTSCFALDNNASHWPMGKIVGGTSMLNNMLYVRGHTEDFNEWFKEKEDYNYFTDVWPYFEKLERNFEENESKGSVYIDDPVFTSVLPQLYLDAVESLGYHITNDTIDCKKGFGTPKINIHKSLRWTSAHSLLSPKKPNVFLRTSCYVEKILFRNNYEAYAVKYSYLDEIYYAKASKGIILSAGVIGTPKILLQSGIGPKKHLEELNITSKINLAVGENLQDHVTTGFDLMLLNKTLGIGIEQMLSPFSIFEYFFYGSGPWTTVGCEGIGFIDLKNDSNRPDLQFMVMPLGINEDNGVHLRRLMGISDYTWNNYFALLNQTKTMTILPILIHPKSRGTLRLRNNDPRSKPVIDPKYLSDERDVEMLLKGIEVIKKIVNTDPMLKIGAAFNRNVFPGCENFKFDSKSYWECYVRHLTITSYHPVGTCKMGSDKDTESVVNFDFQVRGTNNLFVADASVLPTLPSGNINGPVMMMAEMASDIFKYREFLLKEKCSIREVFVRKNCC